MTTTKAKYWFSCKQTGDGQS